MSMYWQFMWFVLAGFVLGFVVSTLWEWFHFRRERMILRDERVAELEAKLQMLERRQAVADVYADDAVWHADEDSDAAVPYADMVVPEPATYPTSQPPRDIDLDIGFEDRAEFPDDVELDTVDDVKTVRDTRWVDADASAVPAAAAALGLAAAAARETVEDAAAEDDTAEFDLADDDTAEFDADADADISEEAIIGRVRTPDDAGAAADADITEGEEPGTVQATIFDAAADADVSEASPPVALGVAAYAAATMADAADEADIDEEPEVEVESRTKPLDPAADADVSEGPLDSLGAFDPHADAEITEGEAPDLLVQGTPFDPHADADISEGVEPAAAFAAATTRLATEFDAANLDTAYFDAAADADISEGPADDVRDRIAGFDAAADADVTEEPLTDGAVSLDAFDPHVDADISEGPEAQASAASHAQAAPVEPDVRFDAPYAVAPNVERDIPLEELLEAPPLPPVAGRVLAIEDRADDDAADGDTVVSDTVASDAAGAVEATDQARAATDAVAADVVDAQPDDAAGTALSPVSEVTDAAEDVPETLAELEAEAETDAAAVGSDTEPETEAMTSPTEPTATAPESAKSELPEPELPEPEATESQRTRETESTVPESDAPSVSPQSSDTQRVTPPAPIDAPLQDLSVEELVNLTVDRLAQAAAQEGGQSLVLSPKARAELAALTAELRTLKPETRATTIDIETPASAATTSAGADAVASESETSDGEEAAEEVGEDVANTGYPDNLSMIKGIGPTYRTRLYEAGITTWRQVAEADVDELRRIARPPVNADVDEWPARAQALAEKHRRMDAEYVGPVPDDFTKIRGIGRHGMFLLYKAGICTFDQLSRAPLDKLAGAIPASPSGEKIDYAAWIEHAKRQIERRRGDA